VPWLISALAVSVVIAFVVGSVDLSTGSWRAIVVGLCVGILFSWEERFTRWWDMRRLRRELARRPIAHRTDAAER
jgi:ABC-type xylose transport system permease subunit